mmetsp:Transcript_40511/g.84624  ORF Transcript_40511/g.84624 Transcript_40511/m.84624 type:complete len:100 (+) Transcript_40511:116-415(+)
MGDANWEDRVPNQCRWPTATRTSQFDHHTRLFDMNHTQVILKILEESAHLECKLMVLTITIVKSSNTRLVTLQLKTLTTGLRWFRAQEPECNRMIVLAR